jgi:hypothetical protein
MFEKSTCIDSNSTFKVMFKDGTSKNGAVGYKRLPIGKDNVQKIQVCYQDKTSEIFNISDAKAFAYGSLGPGCNPVVIPIRPASIYYLRDDGPPKIIENYDVLYVDLLGAAIIDLKTSNTNFKSLLFGGEGLIGFGVTRNISIALGAGAVLEGNRKYFPIKGELRYHLFVDDPTKQFINYKMKFFPDNCMLRNPYQLSDSVFKLPEDVNTNLIMPLDLGTELDSTIFWAPDMVVKKTEGNKYNFKWYLYAEGGTVMDGSFDGAGKESPSPYITINPDEYAEYMWGIGIGTYIWDWVNVSLGYRYLRLNYREPCKDADCYKYAVYTNDVMGVMLRVGLHLGIFK